MLQKKKNNVEHDAKNPTNDNHFYFIFYLLSLLFAVCAMFTKEFTITIPLTLVLVEYLLLRDIPTLRPGRIIRLLPFLIALLVIPAVIRLNSDNPHFNDSGQVEWLREAGLMNETAPGHGESPRLYLLTQSRVFITYLRLLVLPVNQQVDYDYPKIYSLFEPGVVVYLATIISLVIIALYCCKRKILLWPASASGGSSSSFCRNRV